MDTYNVAIRLKTNKHKYTKHRQKKKTSTRTTRDLSMFPCFRFPFLSLGAEVTTLNVVYLLQHVPPSTEVHIPKPVLP